MRRRPSGITLVLSVVLCVVVLIACMEYSPKENESLAPSAVLTTTALTRKAAMDAPPPSAEVIAAQATASFGLTLTPEEIMFGRWWTGTVEDRREGPYLAGPGVYLDFPKDRNWSFAVRGRRVVVIGSPVVRHDLPVFHVSKEPLPPGVAYQDGIPVPEGTDLYKANERTVIEDAHWLPVPDKR